MRIEKLSITLPAEMADTIRERVERGSYATVSEVIREAVRLWQDRELERERRLDVIREKIRVAAENPERVTEEEAQAYFERLYAEAEKRSAEAEKKKAS